MAEIGVNIMLRRKALGMTQEDLAVRLGYKSKSSINKIEMGINDIPQRKIVRLAEVLQTTPAALMGLVDEDTEEKDDARIQVIVKQKNDTDFLMQSLV